MDLNTLTTLADELLTERARAEALTAELADVAAKIRGLEEERIPTAMDEAGMSKFQTASGFTLSVESKVRCGELKREDGLNWLREHGHEGLIRSEVTVPFGVGKDAEATELMKSLAEKQIAANRESKVLWNSLAATIKDLMEKGEDVPLEILGAHIQRTTKVQEPKAKKK